MSKLTTEERNELPNSAFAIPSRRAYPIMDASHRQNALARVSQFGNPEEKKEVRAKVSAKKKPMKMGFKRNK